MKKINLNKKTYFLIIGFILFLLIFGIFFRRFSEPNFYSIIRENSVFLQEKQDLSEVIILMGDSDLVLLGEATHGTQEFYEYRSYISKELIEKHNFNFIAVEGDWNSLYEINLYISGSSNYSSSREILEKFERWPTWMWSNSEIEKLSEWLKDYNKKNPERNIGFYGFDVYGAEKSLNFISDYLDDEYCIKKFENDFMTYPYYLLEGNPSCEENTKKLYNDIKNLEKILDPEVYFNLKQNALVVKNAEKHYRKMINQGPESWNKRILHMNKSIYNIIQHKGEKGILWAHNTHVGDARATEMFNQNTINKGQLLREAEKNVFILGFGTHSGSVAAGNVWGSEMKIFEIPDPIQESIEFLFQDIGLNKNLIIFDEKTPEELFVPRGHRAIGVVYNPEREHLGNFVETILPLRYDAFIFFKETSPIRLIQ